MADNPRVPTEHLIKGQIGVSINTAKAKFPMILSPATPEYYPFIGQIALVWSGFELEFNRFLEIMLKANGTKLSQWWEFWPFASRFKLFQKEAAICFKSHPSILSYIDLVVQDCAESQIKRNTLLHGKLAQLVEISTTDDAANVKISIEVHGRKDGRLVTFVFTPDTLENLYYDICHLGGRIKEMMDENPSVETFSSLDKSFLLALQANMPPLPQ